MVDVAFPMIEDYIPASTMTTRGDMVTRDASEPIRLAVGSANTILRSDGTDPSWGGLEGVLALVRTEKAAASQSIPAGAWTKVAFDVETWDNKNIYDTGTYRCTPSNAGKYIVYIIVQWETIASGKNFYVAIYNNGVIGSYSRRNLTNSAVTNYSMTISSMETMNGSTDYIEAYVYQGDTVARNIMTGGNASYMFIIGPF